MCMTRNLHNVANRLYEFCTKLVIFQTVKSLLAVPLHRREIARRCFTPKALQNESRTVGIYSGDVKCFL
jgi:hypothetical protein